VTAPMLGIVRPHVHRFKLGSFEITTILDGAIVREPVRPPYGVGQPASAIEAQAAANLVRADKFEHTFTVTLVNTGSKLVLFDTGNGSTRKADGIGLLRDLLPAAGYKPEDIDVVAFTHVHPDHILGTNEGTGLAFPNASYAIGQVEFDEWRSGAKIPSQRQENRDLFMRIVVPLADRMTFLKPGQDVVPGIRAVEAFGHSLGLLAYNVESEGKSVLIWGDVANHYVFSLQQPEWRVAFDDDKEQAVATRKRILEMVARDRTTVVGFHMPFPAVGFVEKLNGVYRWLPASYQIRV
jgi:glyoxylase-like metal-dependent hydrolase (beta-lactamase superfamily II)